MKEKRNSERKKCSIESIITVENKHIGGKIENISSKGAYQSFSQRRFVKELFPGVIIDIKFQDSLGEILDIPCEVKRIYVDQESESRYNYNLGLEFVNTLIQEQY